MKVEKDLNSQYISSEEKIWWNRKKHELWNNISLLWVEKYPNLKTYQSVILTKLLNLSKT